MAEDVREIAQRRVEMKRRRRELIAVAVAAVTLVAFVFAQTELPPLTKHTSLSSNLAVITLFNLSFLLLGLLLLLSGKKSRQGDVRAQARADRIEIPDAPGVRLYRGGDGAERLPALCLGRVSARRCRQLVQSRIRARDERLARDREDLLPQLREQCRSFCPRNRRAGRRVWFAGARSPRGPEGVHRETPAGIQPPAPSRCSGRIASSCCSR